MEQMRQNEAGALTAQAIPQKDVEQACFHALGLIGRNCEYLDQHLAHVGADQQTRQAVNDISAAAARLDRTVNEVMSLLDFLRTEEDPRLYPLDLCQLLQQVAAQADMVQAQLGVELTLDYGGWTACRVMADRNDAELLCLHLLSNALRACSALAALMGFSVAANEDGLVRNLLPQGISPLGLLGIAAAALALYALSWRLSVAWYGKAEQ